MRSRYVSATADKVSMMARMESLQCTSIYLVMSSSTNNTTLHYIQSLVESANLRVDSILLTWPFVEQIHYVLVLVVDLLYLVLLQLFLVVLVLLVDMWYRVLDPWGHDWFFRIDVMMWMCSTCG